MSRNAKRLLELEATLKLESDGEVLESFLKFDSKIRGEYRKVWKVRINLIVDNLLGGRE